MRFFSLVLKLCTLALAVTAGGFWTGAGVDSRPKYRDEQTLIGGTIWSQTIITIGLIITEMVQDSLDLYVHAYFLITGLGLFLVTGVMLVYHEYKAWRRNRRFPEPEPRQIRRRFDKIYFGIGVICIFGALFIFMDLIVILEL